jgi:ketosteroid isomerase-like protein
MRIARASVTVHAPPLGQASLCRSLDDDRDRQLATQCQRKASRLLARALTVIALGAVPRAAAQAQASHNFPDGVAIVTTWFSHVQRDELDSLSALLAPDFVFVSDGARFGGKAFVTMIKGLGITHPHVQLSNITARRSGDVGYLVYDRVESFESRGVRKVVPETGTMVLARTEVGWRIVLWTTTSPPR